MSTFVSVTALIANVSGFETCGASTVIFKAALVDMVGGTIDLA